MKWLIYYSEIYFIGKGEPCSRPKFIGCSDKDEKELFTILEKEYPNLPILKLVEDNAKYNFDYYNKIGKRIECPYNDYVYFKSNNSKEF